MRFALLFCAAATAATASPPHHHAASGVVALDVFANGDTADLLVVEQQEGKPVLLHQRSADGGANWGAPVRIGGTPPFGARRGNDPQIAAAGDRVLAVWMTAGTDKWGSGPMTSALSADGGKTWSQGMNPADDGTTTGHGFIDLAVDASGCFHAVWLDSRDGRQGLRHASSRDGAMWSRNATIKPGTCECCPNTLAVSGDRVAVLYRGHDPRDMRVATWRGGAEWSSAGAGSFGWEFDGCPHAGGGLVFAGGSLHALVWTGHAQHAGVHYLASRDGETWSAPRRLGTAEAVHPDIASSGSALAAVWEAGGAIWAAKSAGGARWSTPERIAEPDATQPRIIAVREGFRVFWTEAAKGKNTVWRSLGLSAK